MKSKLKISDVKKGGGMVSDVVEAQLEDNGETHRVVVKHTRRNVEAVHFSHADTALRKAAAKTHLLDRKF